MLEKKGTERELISALANNETKAFESLYLLYGRKLLVFVNGYLNSKDDAEEIVQEVFVKLWKKRAELETHDSLKGYLFTIAYNAIKKRFLKIKREQDLKQNYALEYMHDSGETVSEETYSEVIRQIDSIVEQMPEKRKQVFQLCKKEGLSISEAANYLNISEKTVKNQMTSAYQTIREQLKANLHVLLVLNLFYL
ncbi:RNA polymerase sigma factor [Carboxylicivirga sp. M1479]|uniref:RNA polymerase sigma factor n=1 Tax=Carboxylicivirga sp. M1479 TaxID=2594476 RepID=UPI00163DC966|nr:RNA polymerase sigma-70 factor [Carboxylicivirga sp. M1479]